MYGHANYENTKNLHRHAKFTGLYTSNRIDCHHAMTLEKRKTCRIVQICKTPFKSEEPSQRQAELLCLASVPTKCRQQRTPVESPGKRTWCRGRRLPEYHKQLSGKGFEYRCLTYKTVGKILCPYAGAPAVPVSPPCFVCAKDSSSNSPRSGLSRQGALLVTRGARRAEGDKPPRLPEGISPNGDAKHGIQARDPWTERGIREYKVGGV